MFPTPFGGAPPSLLVLDTTQNPPLPVPLKLGDLNLDGFPDLVPIIVSTPAGGRSKQERTPRILNSVPCAKGVAGCGPEGNRRRGWSELKKGTNVLDSVKDARGIAFLDLDEDVRLFLLLLGPDLDWVCAGYA
jgi:integrin alpha FG-GAP repeat containing protein 1